MPMLEIRATLELARGIRLSFDVEAGIGSPYGEATAGLPASESHPATPEPANRPRNGKARASARTGLEPEPGSGVPGTTRFFVVGHAKSGTSWLMRLLHSHPEIFCRGEGKFFGKDSPYALHGILARSELFQTWLKSNPWTWQDRDPDLEDIVGVVAAYLMAEKARKTNKKFVGDKTPFFDAETVEKISSILPGSKVIHIIRDGRDVAVSRIHHLWNRAAREGENFQLTPSQAAKRDAYLEASGSFGAPGGSIFEEGEVATLARIWKTRVGNATQDGPHLLGGDYYQLRYEDLLTESVAQVRGVFEFLGADSGEEVARACVEAESFEKKAGRKPGEEDPTSFYRKGVSGDWKNIFTEEDRRVFKEEAGDLLIELGYESDDGW